MNESMKLTKAQSLEMINKIPLPLSRKGFYQVKNILNQKAIHYIDLPKSLANEWSRINDEIMTEMQKKYGMSDYE